MGTRPKRRQWPRCFSRSFCRSRFWRGAPLRDRMLTVRGLSRTYSTPDGPIRAIEGVDVSIPDGRFFALLGPSGSGKTTTLRCVAGLEQADEGEIRIGGVCVSDAAARIHVPACERDIG